VKAPGKIVAEQTRSFMIGCANAMALCAETAIQASMIRTFSEQARHAVIRDWVSHPLPCLDNLALVRDMKLAKDFQQFAINLPWSHSPRTIDQGREMAVLDFNTMFELGDCIAGLIYVDTGKAYPEHNHPPAELYFLISGTADWRWGGNHNYQTISAGNLVYNHPYNWHGVKAGATPVLALYLQTA
jgi:hypothetical protein